MPRTRCNLISTHSFADSTSTTITFSDTSDNHSGVRGYLDNVSVATDATPNAVLNYTENNGAVVIDATLDIEDVDDTDIESAVIQITGNYANGEDVLTFVNQNGITGTWTAATGTLSLNGTASIADYETALRSITYTNTSEDPSTATRTVSFTVNDGDVDSNTQTRDIDVTNVNDAPSGADNTVATVRDGTYVFTASDFGYSDIDGDAFSSVLFSGVPTAGTLFVDANNDNIVDGGEAITAPNSVSLTIINNGRVKYQPVAGASGAGYATFTFAVQDDGGTADGGIDTDQAPNTMTIDVNDAYRIEGNIFEDVNGDSNLADAVGASGATVYLYQDIDDDNAITAADTLYATTTTDGSGHYQFTSLTDDTYFVAVDSRTIVASAGLNATYAQTDIWAEQTYGVAGAATGAGFLATDGTLFGGRTADVSDDASSLLTAEHVTRVAVSGADTANIDSAFSFNVVTGVRDGDDVGGEGRSVQGSFRQFVDNSNAIVGGNEMRFVPGVATNDTDGGGNDWWSITLTSNLANIVDDFTTIDGTAYSSVDGVSVLDNNAGQIGSGGTVGLGADGVLGTGDDVTISQFDRKELELVGVATDTYVVFNQNDGFDLRDLAIRKTADGTTTGGLVMLSGSNETLTDTLLGVSADGTSYSATGPNGSFVYLQLTNATVQDNYFGFAGSGEISAVSASHADNAQLIGNEVDGAFDFGFSAYGDNLTVRGNLLDGIVNGFGIGTFYQSYTGVTVENNTIQNTTGYSAISAGFGSIDTTIRYNVVQNNTNGINVHSDGGANDDARNAVISMNSVSGTTDPGIDVYNVNANDGAFTSTDPNEGIDHPIITNANLVGGNLSLTGYVGDAPNDTDFANARVEFFLSDGGGDGQTYLGFLTTDANGNFSGTLAVTGVVDTDAIVATATMTSVGTSEFGNEFGVNVAPTNTVPGNQSVNEDTALAISGVSVSDSDSNIATVQLSVGDGTISATLQGAATFSAGSSGSSTFTLSGTSPDINATLATLSYQGNLNFNGTDTLTVLTTDDGGLTDSDSFDITVDAVNDDPTNAGSTPADLVVIEDVATNIDLSDITIADPDENGGSITVTLATTSGGTLNSVSGGGVAVGGSGTDTITVDGTVAAINNFLQFASNIQFTGSQDIYGDNADAITVTVNDNGNSGSGGGSDVLLETVNVDITAVNDSPVIAGLGGDSVSVFNDGVAKRIDVLSPASIDDAKDGTVDFSGGTLTLSGNSFEALDVLGLDVTGAISLSASFSNGSVISVSGVAIGTLSGVSNDSATITFNANATVARVDSLVQSFTFETTAATLGARTLDLVMNDGDGTANGGSQTSQTATVNIAVGLAGGGLVTTPEDTTYTYTATDFDFTGITGTDLDTITITSLPMEGRLQLNGVDVVLNQEITKAQIDANLLTFVPDADENGALYASFDFYVNEGKSTVNVLAGEPNSYTLNGGSLAATDQILADSGNFGLGGTYSSAISVGASSSTIDAAYLAQGSVLFDGFVADGGYTAAELSAIDSWVNGGGILIATSDTVGYDDISNFYGLTIGGTGNATWNVADSSHAIMNGPFGLVGNNGDPFQAAGSISYFNSASLAVGDVTLATDSVSGETDNCSAIGWQRIRSVLFRRRDLPR